MNDEKQIPFPPLSLSLGGEAVLTPAPHPSSQEIYILGEEIAWQLILSFFLMGINLYSHAPVRN
jgi:hypothetical protein